jgi:deoxyhypusine synthase
MQISGGIIFKIYLFFYIKYRNGADFGVFINTGMMYEGSDAGATISEAISWGKLQIESSYVKVWSEASLVFPILVA